MVWYGDTAWTLDLSTSLLASRTAEFPQQFPGPGQPTPLNTRTLRPLMASRGSTSPFAGGVQVQQLGAMQEPIPDLKIGTQMNTKY